jgi:GT2 family glycosyltransferase
MNEITIIIPVKNDSRRLSNCLQSIARNVVSAGAPPALIVVDNGSTDESPAVAAEAGARVLVLPDLRVSELRNAGAAAASSDLLAFVDADHEIAATWVGAAGDAFASRGVGAAGALYTAPETGTWVQRMYGILRGRTVGRTEVPWLGSGNLVVRRLAFEQIGGFDVSLEACEDVDLCQRLRASGWTIIGDERLKSVHAGDPPTLAALFRAERWRGRDNLRVSLRGPLNARDLPSALTPVLTLAALLALPVALAAVVVAKAPWWAPLVAAGIIVGLAAFKTMRLGVRARCASPWFLLQALAVALTYDVARSVALISRAPHHRHRQTEPETIARPASQ